MTPDPNRSIFSVAALIQHADGDILTISRRNDPNNIGLIGGKVDPGETPIQAVIREIEEECGVIVLEEDLEPIFDRLDSPEETWKVCRTFRVKKWKGHPRTMEDGLKVRWSTLPELLRETNTFAHYNYALFTHLGLVDCPVDTRLVERASYMLDAPARNPHLIEKAGFLVYDGPMSPEDVVELHRMTGPREEREERDDGVDGGPKPEFVLAMMDFETKFAYSHELARQLLTYNTQKPDELALLAKANQDIGSAMKATEEAFAVYLKKVKEAVLEKALYG